ncbi:MAG: hypothetical protein KGL67_01250 [Patescibacteria group bacterium]|nr:hypothetical protein [Patescibacteria group bacterium]
MNDKLTKVIGLIQEGLKYSDAEDNRVSEDGVQDYGIDKVELYEDTLRSAGLSREDIYGILKNLRNDGVIKLQQVFYAPERTPSNYENRPRYKVPADDEYKLPVYVLHINREKLQPSNSNEPFSFDAETGLLHFQGKTCELPLKQFEYYVIKALTAQPIGKHVEEADIEEIIDALGADGSKSRVYDTRRRINKRVKEELGIENLVGYSNSTYWINQP